MAITVAHMDGGTINPPGTSPATASVAFADNRLYLLTIGMRGGTTPDVTAVSGGGITWTKTTTSKTTAPSFAQYRGLATSGTSTGTLTMTTSGVPTQFKYTLDEFAGVNTTTPIVQTAAMTGGSNATIGTVALSAFGSAVNNAAFGAFITNVAETDMPVDASGGWTRLFFDNTGTPVGAMMAQYKVGEDTSVTCDWPSSTNIWAGGASEIAAAQAATSRKLRVTTSPNRW